MKVAQITGAKGFDYSPAPQRSPEWLAIHVGRVGASDLYRWLAVGKRDGKPLKARLDLEREIAFARSFRTPFSRYATGAMLDGIANEDFVRDQYSSQMGTPVEKCGCFYNDYFVASPDGLVGDDGCLEIKWLQDNNFTAVLESQQPLPDHYLQMQGQLWATGRAWCDYVAANGNTGRFVVITVKRDEDVIKQIAESVPAVADITPMATDGIFAFSGTVPAIEQAAGEAIWG